MSGVDMSSMLLVRTNSNNITNVHTESWRDMRRQVFVSLLITICKVTVNGRPIK